MIVDIEVFENVKKISGIGTKNNFALVLIDDKGGNKTFLFSNDTVVDAVNFLFMYIFEHNGENLKCKMTASKLFKHRLIITDDADGIVQLAYADFENISDRRNAPRCVNALIEGMDADVSDNVKKYYEQVNADFDARIIVDN